MSLLSVQGRVEIDARRVSRRVSDITDNAEILKTIEAWMKKGRDKVAQATPGSKEFKQGWKIATKNLRDKGRRKFFILEHEIEKTEKANLIKWLNEGTKAHEIVPRNAQALAFEIGGTSVSGAVFSPFGANAGVQIFAARVQHPGNKAYKMLFIGKSFLVAELPKIRDQVARLITKRGKR